MAYAITSATDLGNDVLEVKALTDEGEELVSFGWVSATTNYFTSDSYDADGNRAEDAAPRAMTATEVGDYARSLIDAEHFPVAPPAPQPIAFE